ncbi:MAG: LamG-like jellyroll fold domain-containing protein, partial [Candidatus Parabeggiatoa sp.]|nr:LamG-like jellyroll fold domain-containing protein [Candidatus Parabeggiatoa sp.]
SVSVALGDVDNDDDLDAFVANTWGGTDKVWLNNGMGTFSDSGQNLGNSSSYGVALGDVDNDGDLDAFVSNASGQPNNIWQNDGTGTFNDSGLSLGDSDGIEVALGDVDGDGDLDAFVANYRQQSNKVWLNNSTSTVTGSACGGVTEGLVACYPFDGDANDGSVNKDNGIEIGHMSYVDGVIGQAAKFDGTGYIKLPQERFLDTACNATITAWIKNQATGDGTWHEVLASGDNRAANDPITLQFQGSLLNNYGYRNVAAGNIATTVTQEVVFNKNQWYLLSTVLEETDEGSRMLIYANEQLVYTQNTANKVCVGYDVAMETNIGAIHGNQRWVGLLDEVRIYNRALSESEIKQLYELDSDDITLTLTKTGEGEITSTDNTINCGETCEADYEVESTVTLTATPATGSSFTGWSGDCSGTSATTSVTMDAAKSCMATFKTLPTAGCNSLSDGLVACYTFDGNANDGSGNGNHATAYSGVRYTAGKAGQAVKLSGNTLDYLRIKNPKQKFDNQYSIAAWVSTNGRGQVLLSKYSWNPGMRGFSLFFSTPDGDGRGFSGSTLFLNAGFNNEWWVPSKYPSYTLPINKFQYVSAVYNAGNFKLYVDGILASEKTVQHASTLDNPYDILIGSYFQDNGTRVVASLTGRTFDGLIDELRVYNRALSESEIKQLYELDSDNDNSSGQKTITVNKTGKGRGTVKIDISAEDRTHFCKTDCSEMTQPLFTADEIVLTATPAKGFIFKQWAGECSGTDNRITVPMTASKTCIADFDLDPNAEMYPLTVNNKEGSQGRLVAKGGIDCGEKCTAYYPGGQKVRLEAHFNEADTLFLGWKGDCSGFQNQVSVTMDAAKSCSATFKPYNPDEQFALIVNNSGDGVGTISGREKGETTSLVCRGKAGCKQAQQAYASGSQITLSAIPDTGFEFTGGSGECAWESDTDQQGRLKGSATVIIDQAKTCTAEFGLKADLTWHTLTLQLVGTGNGSVNNPARIDCGNQCTADYYEAGKPFYIKAEPTALSQFIGWSGDCEGKGTGLKITMNQDMTCSAQFKSDFEILAEEIVEAFYATAKSGEGTPIGEIYPQPDNQARLKEAFWVAITAILQTDQALIISESQSWPTQFDGINWLPSDTSTSYADSVQVIANQFIGIEVELLDQNGGTEKVGIVIYYSDEAPIIDDGGWSRPLVRVA